MNELFVEDVMIKDVAYVSLPGSRDEVLKTLKDRCVSGVPVVKDSVVVGIVTRSDLLRNPEEDQIALLMSRDPYVVRPRDTIYKASKIMIEQGIRRLPVVDHEKLLGILTVADVMKVIADLNIDEPLGKLIERKVVVVWDEMPLQVAGAVMEYADVQACPVLDSSLKLVGIVSDRDLINASVIEDYVEKSDMSAATDEDEWCWESMRDTMSLYYGISRIKLREIPVRDAMVPAITAVKSSEVSECARVMQRKKIDQLPVVTANQKLMGIIRDRNLLKALISHYES